MKSPFTFMALLLAAALQTATAQSTDDGPMTEAEVRKVDLDTGRITLRHGEIANLQMPPMTMVFRAREAALLQGLKPGDRVRFRAEKVEGGYAVTAITPVTAAP